MSSDGDNCDMHQPSKAPKQENVLIDGQAYTVPMPVAVEMLRLTMALKAATEPKDNERALKEQNNRMVNMVIWQHSLLAEAKKHMDQGVFGDVQGARHILACIELHLKGFHGQ